MRQFSNLFIHSRIAQNALRYRQRRRLKKKKTRRRKWGQKMKWMNRNKKCPTTTTRCLCIAQSAQLLQRQFIHRHQSKPRRRSDQVSRKCSGKCNRNDKCNRNRNDKCNCNRNDRRKCNNNSRNGNSTKQQVSSDCQFHRRANPTTTAAMAEIRTNPNRLDNLKATSKEEYRFQCPTLPTTSI